MKKKHVGNLEKGRGQGAMIALLTKLFVKASCNFEVVSTGNYVPFLLPLLVIAAAVTVVFVLVLVLVLALVLALALILICLQPPCSIPAASLSIRSTHGMSMRIFLHGCGESFFQVVTTLDGRSCASCAGSLPTAE